MSFDLAQLYDAHASALFAFLLNLTRNETDTREVLQEVFLKIARRPEALNAAQDARAFLLRMAHNLAVDGIRRRKTYVGAVERMANESEELFAPVDTVEEEEFRAAVQSALGELPEEQRAVVHLKLWENLTFAQIAMMLEIPANTAASRYRYALDKLRVSLRPICES